MDLEVKQRHLQNGHAEMRTENNGKTELSGEVDPWCGQPSDPIRMKTRQAYSVQRRRRRKGASEGRSI